MSPRHAAAGNVAQNSTPNPTPAKDQNHDPRLDAIWLAFRRVGW